MNAQIRVVVPDVLAANPADPDLPTLPDALDPVTAAPALARALSKSMSGDAPQLQAIRVIAYKPHRRCLIEYEVAFTGRDGVRRVVPLLGKMRARRYGHSGYRLLRAIWGAGFEADSADGISVPEPVATVSSLRLWLQRKVSGQVATIMLRASDAAVVATQIAQAVHKLHTAGVPAERRHTVDDELRILVRCLCAVAAAHPDLATRAHRLLDACGRLAQTLPTPTWCGSHRDFYADQVLIDGHRVTLVDFDLYCEADPGLDLGNFLGHVSEQSLREFGRADALETVERVAEDRFSALAGEAVRWAVRVYAALTLARHVYLSTRIAGRGHLTASILTLATERVHRLVAEGGHA